MKKILLLFAFILLAITFLDYRKTHSQETNPTSPKNTAPVTIQTIANSASIKENLIFPGIILEIDEAKITAKTAGTITALNFDLGKTVATGQLLLTIDDTGNNLDFSSKNNLKSANVQQLEQALSQAKSASALAKRTVQNHSGIVNQTAHDIAKSQAQSVQIALQAALDNHLITAPISGKITSQNVALGDSVTQGQLLATMSKSNQVKIQFFVDAEQYTNFSVGLPLTLTDNNQKNFTAKIITISPQADSATGKFLIEALPDEKNSLLSGTVIDVIFPITKTATKNDSILIPLSAITIGQNESYLFIAENGKAKKTIVSIDNITGEVAQINLSLPKETQIIITGNKTLQDGDAIEIKNN